MLIKAILKEIGAWGLLLAAVFAILNWAFLWKNLSVVFHRSVLISILSADNNNVASVLPTSGPTQNSGAVRPVPPVGVLAGAETAVRDLPPDTLQIPSLGIRAPIIYVNEASEAVYQPALEKGVVHFSGTANPGEYGRVYIFGHSSDYIWSKGKYKTVFASLPRIRKGADIYASNQNGEIFIYTVTDSFVAKDTDVHLLQQNGYIKKQLMLQTSYPVGTALKRWIVIAELGPE